MTCPLMSASKVLGAMAFVALLGSCDYPRDLNSSCPEFAGLRDAVYEPARVSGSGLAVDILSVTVADNSVTIVWEEDGATHSQTYSTTVRE